LAATAWLCRAKTSALQGENLGARITEALGGRQIDLVLDGEGGETVSKLA
jgi:hypothetical protein